MVFSHFIILVSNGIPTPQMRLETNNVLALQRLLETTKVNSQNLAKLGNFFEAFLLLLLLLLLLSTKFYPNHLNSAIFSLGPSFRVSYQVQF